VSVVPERIADIVDSGYSVGDPDDARIGTERGPGRVPGARKPGRKKKRDGPLTIEERRVAIQRRIAKQVARDDFDNRVMELRRLYKTYPEIASIMSIERKEAISVGRVSAAAERKLVNTDTIDMVRYAELDKLETQSANILQKLMDMDELAVALLDIELYAKLSETYLKYRERVAKLVGLDAPVKQQIDRGALAPGEGFGVHVGVDGVTIHMPGSVAAFEEWQQLSAKGLTSLAHDVLELEAGEHEEIDLDGFHGERAGVTLNPHADVTPGAERQARSALEALELLGSELTGDDGD
jgi:hypothetical protein